MTAATIDDTPTREYRAAAPIIANEWRDFVSDVTKLEALEVDYPYLAHQLGRRAARMHVLRAADNDVGSFKWRGAFNAVNVARQTGAKAIVAATAGNHGAGVAAAARYFDLPATIVMPGSAPKQKSDVVESYGANVVRVAGTVDDAVTAADVYHGAFIHPYDNEAVINGQGSLLDDLLADGSDIDTVVATVGGGGMLAGMMQRASELGLEDTLRFVGVVPDGATSLRDSLHNNDVRPSVRPNSLFGGACVRSIGKAGLSCIWQSSATMEIRVVDDDAARDVAELHLQQNHDLLRTDVPEPEPTSLLAMTALQQLDASYGNVAVVMSGINEPLLPWLARTR